MSIESRTVGGVPEYYDTTTHETIWRAAPLTFVEDFRRGRNFRLSGNMTDMEAVFAEDESLFSQIRDTDAPWAVVETGSISHIRTLDSDSNGVVEIAATASDDTQVGVLYWGDERTINVGRSPVFETRVRMPVLATGLHGELTTIMVGLAHDHHATADSIASSAWFRCYGSGAAEIETDDGTTDSQQHVDYTVSAGAWYVLRIEFNGSSAVFKVDERVIGRASMAALGVDTQMMQPYFRVSKVKSAANMSVGSLWIDYVKLWESRG